MTKEKTIKELLVALRDFNSKLGDVIEHLSYEPEEETVAQERQVHFNKSQENQHPRGLRGMAQVFNCSIATASRMKATGLFDSCISQVGRTFVIDKEKALELAKLNNRKNRRKA